jgi:hypothetical protein
MRQRPFYNVEGLDLPRNRTGPDAAVTYLNLLQNIGTIDWHTSMPIAENAAPRYFVTAANQYVPNPEYQGEAFLVEDADPSRSPARATFSPNTIAVDVTVRAPGTLVINQNYHPAWESDRGELFDRDGLIALRLRERGSYTIRLRYLPRSFVAGLAVSLLSITGWALACRTFLAWRLERWAHTRHA